MATKKKYVWIGVIPEVAGEDITVIAESKADVNKGLREKYKEIAESDGDYLSEEDNTFKKAFEYHGGYYGKAELGKAFWSHNEIVV